MKSKLFLVASAEILLLWLRGGAAIQRRRIWNLTQPCVVLTSLAARLLHSVEMVNKLLITIPIMLYLQTVRDGGVGKEGGVGREQPCGWEEFPVPHLVVTISHCSGIGTTKTTCSLRGPCTF
jgi:hypothetical protein